LSPIKRNSLTKVTVVALKRVVHSDDGNAYAIIKNGEEILTVQVVLDDDQENAKHGARPSSSQTWESKMARKVVAEMKTGPGV
jgi:hypothetical protein